MKNLNRISRRAAYTLPDSEKASFRLFFPAVFLISLAVRVALAFVPRIATTYGDELIYLELAQNIWLRGSLTVYTLPVHFTKLLYPVLLSPFYAIQDPGTRMASIAVFNAVLINSALIPAWLSAKVLLKKERARRLALLTAAVSPALSFSVTCMAENLFIPLALWCFYVLLRAAACPERRFALSAAAGFLAFLLYFTRETGTAFFGGAAAVYLSMLAGEKGNRRKNLFSLLIFLAGCIVPFICCRLTVLAGIPYTYREQVSLSALSSPQSLVYLLYSMLATGVYFLMSGLFFPVVLPLICFRSLNGIQRRMALFSAMYALLIALGTAFAVSLPEDAYSPDLRIHLRYFFPVLYCFLTVFLSLAEDTLPLKRGRNFSLRDPVYLLFLLFAGLLLFVVHTPVFGSLVDAPQLYLFQLLGDFWPRLICTVLAAAGGILLLRREKTVFVFYMISALLIWETAAGAVFVLKANEAEAAPSVPSVAEVTALDQALDGKEDGILVIRDNLYHPAGRLMDTYTNDDYRVAYTEDIQRLGQESAVPGTILLSNTTLPVPERIFAEAVQADSFRYIVTADPGIPLSPNYYEDVTPDEVSSWKIYRALDPQVIYLKYSTDYRIGEAISFYGTEPSFTSFAPRGFSAAEPDFTWTDGNLATFVVLPVWEQATDLTADFVYAGTNGPQQCRIYANDLLLWEGVLEGNDPVTFSVPAKVFTDYSFSGEARFSFELPDAAEPGNGDSRKLGIAFRTFLLRYP